jgi:hypothetical protein
MKPSTGEDSNLSKLTESQVKMIKLSSDNIRNISNKMKIPYTTIYNIKKGITWKHL